MSCLVRLVNFDDGRDVNFSSALISPAVESNKVSRFEVISLEQPAKEEKKISIGKNITFPLNVMNSCYIDSVLVALFYQENQLISDRFLTSESVGPILTDITKSMRLTYSGKESTTTDLVIQLRKILSSRKTEFSIDVNDGKQHDASEFLAILVRCLGLDNDQNKQQLRVFGTNEILIEFPTDLVLTTDRVDNLGIVLTIFDWTSDCQLEQVLESKDDSHLLDAPFLDKQSDTLFYRKLTQTKFMPQDVFIIHFDRTSGGKLKTESVSVPESITISGKNYTLHACVLRSGTTITGGHFTSIIKRNDTWMSYNDMFPILQPMTSSFTEIGKQVVLAVFTLA